MLTALKAHSKSKSKRCTLMNNLEVALQNIHANVLLDSHNVKPEWDVFCEQYEPLFNKVNQNKPNTSATHHLLGVLTKAHIEAQTLIHTHQESMSNMEKVLKDNLGEEHASRFENQSQKQLIFVTHLWLYLQGYLQMDFSLANDHAEQTAKTITQISGLDSNTLRTEFLGSYYQGIELSPIEKKRHPILDWLKSFFNS